MIGGRALIAKLSNWRLIMKKRILPALLVVVLLVCTLPGTAFAAGGLSYFSKVNTYQSGHFTDIASTKWYAPYVQASYEYGLVNGKTVSAFEPDATLTVAEAVKLAVSINSIYYSGSVTLSNGTPIWFKTYTEYALANDLIDTDYPDYNAPVTRSDFALILSKALPAEALSVKNNIVDNAIPDVPLGYSYSDAVYTLYRAGVLTGSDNAGNFLPNDTLKRSEAAAIVTRMVNASYRQQVSLGSSLTASDIFEKCSPAVFYIKILDINGITTKTGSGFFINQNGLAVTNYHVISNAAKAVISTSDGKEYNITGVYGFDKDKDYALIQVDGTGFKSLSMADSDTVKTGAAAYAIGSPMGYKNTISVGIISSASRIIGDLPYIQTTAAISSGSSGGALLDASGNVIGITSMTAVGAQNINLAVPINLIKSVPTAALTTLQSLLPQTTYYSNYYPTPDFGAFSQTPLFFSESFDEAATFYYKTGDMPVSVENALSGYTELLEENTFSFYGYAIEGGSIITYYLNSAYGTLVTFGETNKDGVDCIRVQIMAF